MKFLSKRKAGWKSLIAIKHLWLCIFLGFLFMRYALAVFLSERNRFYLHWQRSDAWGAILAVVVVGLALYGAYLVVRSFGRPGQVSIELGFVLFSLFFLKVAICEMAKLTNEFSVVLKGIVVVLFLLSLVRRRQVVRSLQTVCLILSPVFPVVAGQFLAAQTYNVSYDRDAAIQGQVEMPEEIQGSIFLFLFDQWSYPRSFAGGNVLADFPNIARAAETAVIFHKAYSPAPLTASSIPSMLCGVVGHAQMRDGRHYLDGGGHTVPTRERSNVFLMMKEKGYRTCLYAHYLPWAELLVRGPDRCESRSSYRVFGLGPLRTCGQVLLENTAMRF